MNRYNQGLDSIHSLPRFFQRLSIKTNWVEWYTRNVPASARFNLSVDKWLLMAPLSSLCRKLPNIVTQVILNGKAECTHVQRWTQDFFSWNCTFACLPFFFPFRWQSIYAHIRTICNVTSMEDLRVYEFDAGCCCCLRRWARGQQQQQGALAEK